MKYNGPKAKRVRRYGVNIYGSDKYDKILQRKPQGPGKGPRSKQGRLSEYAQQLKEKQKARDMFGLSERQFHSLYALASKVSGQTDEIFKQLLERRLDNMIYRAGFAHTRPQARQFISHGLFTVNGRRVTIPSFRVRPGEVIVVRGQRKSSPVFPPILAAHEKYNPPKWLKVDSAEMKVEVVSLPAPEDTEQSIDVRQIVEFYSRN
ncbi:MAG: 30S ribosomal protein S4 [Candidatus Peregrinibacteria bacterium]|nr:30S ribosomal protein S4 [Candidatus Peregrinibacteria bacterium]